MKFKSVVLISGLLLSTATAEASTLTYDMVLNSSAGPESGQGSFTVSGPIASTGLTVFTAGSGLSALNFSIDNTTFTLANELLNATVTFNNGSLISVAYLGSLDGFKLDLGTAGLNYAFVDLINAGLTSIGSIAASPVSEAPLPPSWTLMLIGLAGFGVVAYRRRSSVAPA
jgi:hypothetical protein